MSRLSRVSATESWSGFASYMWTLVLCVGGCSFGLILGGLFGAIMQPIVEVLGK
jgi:hypothetical protein